MAGVGTYRGLQLKAVLAMMEQAHRELDYSPVTSEFLPILRKAHQGFFSAGTDANGKPWAPLRPSTIRKKGHGIILVETDRLMDSLTKNTGDSILAIHERGAVFGTSVPYAVFHQMGTNKLPRRPPVGIDKTTLDDMVKRVADHEVEALKG